MAQALSLTAPTARARRIGERSLRWAALVVLACSCLSGGIAALTSGPSGAATSGWYVAAVPGSGADDVLLGTSCPDATRCIATGVSITNISGSSGNTTYAPLIESWNGTSWALESEPPLPSGDGGGLFDVSCVDDSDCWGVGALIPLAQNGGNPSGTLIEHWDGTSWSMVASPTPSGPNITGALLMSVSCASASSCIAVGYASDDTGANLNDVIEQWNGTSWSIVPGADTGQSYDQLNRVQCLNADDCWAVGNAGPVQQNPNFLPIFPGNAPGDQGLIEHWDGAAWSLVPSASEASPGGGYLYGLDCVSDSQCWASGSTTDSTGNASGILMEQWNGSAWSDVSSSVPEPPTTYGGILSSISCLDASQCWAVGSYGKLGGPGGMDPQSFVENWNGSSWSIEPSPDVTEFSYLNALSCLGGVGCTAVGGTATSLDQNSDPGLRAYIEQMSFPPTTSQGLVLGARDGGVFAYGTAPFEGSMGGQHLNAPIVGVAETPDGAGYWLVASDGGVFAFGDAGFYGSMGGQHLNRPIVGIAPSSDGRGYWMVASDGGVFAYGDAAFEGSMGGQSLNAPVVGIAPTGHGGYWLVASDGGVFSFGGASFLGSAASLPLAKPVTGMAATPDGGGYWLVAADGGLFTYGDAPYLGSVPGQGIVGQPTVVGISRSPSGQGYWLAGSNGAVYSYGDAAFLGAPNASRLVAPVSGIAAS